MEMSPEHRENERFRHRVTITFENYATGTFHEGRLLNYSRGGMCFEADVAPEIGAEIFIGMEKSPYSATHDVYRARVIWHRSYAESESFYYYGIGVKFC